MSEPLVVTVIPNWNLRDDLAACLESLRRARYSRHQIVVVDNASTDDSVALVRARFPEAHVIARAENGGYAAALNDGIEHARALGAAYVFALNNDTIVDPDALATLVREMEANPDIGIAAPRVLLFADPSRLYRAGDRMYRWLPLPLSFGVRRHDGARYHRTIEFDYVSGCAMLIRAALFDIIGLFDESWFMYYEDSDFCRRARDRGFRITYVGRAVVYHKVSLSTSKEPAAIRRIRARNRVRFYRRHPHGPHPWLTYVAIAVIAAWRIAHDLLRGQHDQIRPYVEGLWQGWREAPSGPA
jgi:GT2 family glycosyltransferase